MDTDKLLSLCFKRQDLVVVHLETWKLQLETLTWILI